MHRQLAHRVMLLGRMRLAQASSARAGHAHGLLQGAAARGGAPRTQGLLAWGGAPAHRGLHSPGALSLLPPAARAAAGGAAAAARQRLRAVSDANREAWAALEARAAVVVSGFSLTAAGQALLAAFVPVTLAAALFPSRLRAYAYELPPGGLGGRRGAAWAPPRAAAGLAPPKPAGPLRRALRSLSEELALAARGLYLLALFAPVVLGAPVAFYLGLGRDNWTAMLLWTLERAGPAFIKWAQWMSSRPDLLPADVCGALERLQSAAPAHSGAHSIAAVEAAFRRPLREVFSAWEVAPVASGSIAQIHRAALAPGAAAACGVAPGTVVAVKVRHPGVDDLMLRDFALMQRAAAAAGRLPGLRALRLDESVRQFGGPLKEQLDLSVEASHLERFAHNFRRWRNVVFPRPIYPLVAPGVLVESYEAGSGINGYVSAAGAAAAAEAAAAAAAAGGGRGGAAASGSESGRRRQERVAEEIAETGLNVYLQMLLKDNFIHADMHPGNILVREVARPPPALPLPPQLAWTGRLLQGALQRLGAAVAGLPLPAAAGSLLRNEPQLVLLDTGMIAELSAVDQKNVVAFFRALTSRDGEKLAHAILDMSERHTCPDQARFVAALTDMFDRLDPETIRQCTSDVLRDMIETIRQHQVTLKSTVSTVVVTTLVLEGWSSRLHPDLSIMDTLRDVLATDWRARISKTVDRIMSGDTQELAIA
ncbi:MAG: ABC1 family-domain-containing protein [Monoraphidium minutum]|nr:MAG: ABC1 family-domain-containing protein [Monoraphidium minutum]